MDSKNTNTPLKVIQINTLGATLSTGRTTRELHEFLKINGVESKIVCPAPLDCEDAFFFSSRRAMKIDTAMTMLTGLEGYHSRIATKRLIKFLNKEKPDVVHLRILHSNYINLKMLFKFLSQNDIATVITLHDFWYLTGKCCFYTNLKCDKWISGCYKCPLPNNPKRPRLFERSKKMWRDKKDMLQSVKRLALVGVSQWVADETQKSPFSSNKIVRCIYNWIDLDVFCPRNTTDLRQSMDLTDKFLILGVSAYWKLNDRKGLDVYIKLSEILPSNFAIILIGNMDETVDLPKNIISVGTIKDKNMMPDYYSMADVYLNISTEETFGKVSAEAISCGTPIIALDATANKEIMPENGGYIIKSKNVDEIFNSIMEVYKKGKESFSSNCINFAHEKFNFKNNARKYLDLYLELCEK